MTDSKAAKARRYEAGLKEVLDGIFGEAFGTDQERIAKERSNPVGLLIQQMLLGKVIRQAFRAGWVAAGKKAPEE